MSPSAEVLVVGGGTAGCVIAGRLAEAGREVTVLEAGPDHGPFSRTWPPDLLDAGSNPDSHDWGYIGPGAEGQPLAFQRARVIGGCSAHNGCVQSVGWGPDYDKWATDTSLWRASELESAFAASRERLRIRTFDPEEIQPFHRAFVEAAGEAGIPIGQDFDDLHAGISVGYPPVNIVESGMRWNTSFAYLDPVRSRQNIKVLGGVAVDRLLIRNGRAVGVETIKGGTRSSLTADHVVVSGGAYGTPELLLRSGVGPADELRSHDVDVAVDLPGVGSNLHDQPVAQMEFAGTETLAKDLGLFSRDHWLPEEQAAAKLASSLTEAPYDLHAFPWIERDPSLESGWRIVMPIGLLEPRSRGKVVVQPSNGGRRIDHGFLRSELDTRALAEGVRWMREELLDRSALKRYLGTVLSAPGEDESVEAWIRHNHKHYWHPAGSCRMGPPDDRMSVVDASGSLHGAVGITIADASVFPQIPRATPAWPVVAMAEQIASLIKL